MRAPGIEEMTRMQPCLSKKKLRTSKAKVRPTLSFRSYTRIVCYVIRCTHLHAGCKLLYHKTLRLQDGLLLDRSA